MVFIDCRLGVRPRNEGQRDQVPEKVFGVRLHSISSGGGKSFRFRLVEPRVGSRNDDGSNDRSCHSKGQRDSFAPEGNWGAERVTGCSTSTSPPCLRTVGSSSSSLPLLRSRPRLFDPVRLIRQRALGVRRSLRRRSFLL